MDYQENRVPIYSHLFSTYRHKFPHIGTFMVSEYRHLPLFSCSGQNQVPIYRDKFHIYRNFYGVCILLLPASVFQPEPGSCRHFHIMELLWCLHTDSLSLFLCRVRAGVPTDTGFPHTGTFMSVCMPVSVSCSGQNRLLHTNFVMSGNRDLSNPVLRSRFFSFPVRNCP